MDALVWLSLGTVAVAVAAALPPPRSRVLDRAVSSGSASALAGGPGESGDLPWLRWVATASVGLGAVVLVGGVVGAVAGFVAAVVCWRLCGRMEAPAVRRRRERLVASVPHVVDLMASCLAAGLPPAAAAEQIADAVDSPMRDELTALSARLRLGVDPVTVWRELSAHPQLGGLGRGLARAVESGSSVADAMLRLAEDLRRKSRADVESRARAVGVKAAVPLGVCMLPAFVLVGVVPLVAGSVSVLVGR